MHQRGFAPIFILLAVIIAGGAGFLFVKAINTENNNSTKPADEQPRKININFSDLLSSQEQDPTSTIPPSLNDNTPAPDTVNNTNQNLTTGSFKAKVAGGRYLQPLSANVQMSGQGVIKATTSGSDGWFTITNLPVGGYKIVITHSEYDFSEFDVQVNEGENVHNRTLNGFLKNFQPSSISGQTFIDYNGNGTKDGSDTGLAIFLTLYAKTGNSWVNNQTINTDSQGNFSFQLDTPSDYKLEPVVKTFYRQPGPVEFTVDGYGGNKNYQFAYYPTSSQDGFIIFVFNDKNENGNQDTDEEHIHYQYARVTNTISGESYNLAVSESGAEVAPTDYGDYKLELIPEDDYWNLYYKITKKEAIVFVYNTSGKQEVKLGAHKLY